MEHGFKIADLHSQLGSLSIRSLPIITQEQITLPQHTIGRRSMGEFNDRVYEVVRRVPRGKVAAYGQIARLIGQPRKARFVGYAMHGNPDPWDCAAQTGIPCHRVVFKDGALAPGFAFGGPDEQRARLAAEGVSFLDDGRVDMRACQWDGRSVDGAGGGETAEGPTAPPIDFDWAAELRE